MVSEPVVISYSVLGHLVYSSSHMVDSIWLHLRGTLVPLRNSSSIKGLFSHVMGMFYKSFGNINLKQFFLETNGSDEKLACVEPLVLFLESVHDSLILVNHCWALARPGMANAFLYHECLRTWRVNLTRDRAQCRAHARCHEALGSITCTTTPRENRTRTTPPPQAPVPRLSHPLWSTPQTREP